MNSRHLKTIRYIISVVMVLFLVFEIFHPSPQGSQAFSLTATPSIISVEPSEGPNDLDTRITISGNNFEEGAEVFIGETLLNDILLIDETSIEATVPWGMEPDIYSLQIVNPGSEFVQLLEAYTVTQGIGEWMTGGPYGGWINHITIGATPDTVYASVKNVGLFRTRDGGENWELIFIEIGHTNILEMDPRNSDWLYIAKRLGNLYHSEDGGDTWTEMPIPIPGNPTGMLRVFVSPHDYQLYGALASGNFDGEQCEDGCGLFVFDEAGQTWTRLSYSDILDENTGITMVGFDPSDPDTIYAGGSRGQVIMSDDGGETWSELPVTPLTYIVKMFINPYDGSVWITGAGEGRSGGCYKLGLDTWVAETPIGVTAVYDMAFDPASDSIWISAGEDGMYTSTNGGVDWSMINVNRSEALDLYHAPITVIYSGSNEGMEKNTPEEGVWEQKNTGITGWVPVYLGMNPQDPAIIYGVVDSAGIFGTTSGGASWERLKQSTGGPIVVDPVDPTHVVNADYDRFRIAYDGRNFDLDVPIDLPEGMSSTNYQVIPLDLIARPGLWVMSAAYLDRNAGTWNYHGGGGIYLSATGNTWTLVTPIQECPVTAVSFDPVDENILYAVGSDEGANENCDGGFLKSIDYGLTWQSSPFVPEIGWGKFMAVEPTPPYRIFLDSMFSSDQGETWTTMWTPFSSYNREAMLFIEGTPSALYVATGGGLYRTLNGGLSWIKAQGALGELEVWSLAGLRIDEREILFAATIGGEIPSETASASLASRVASTLVNGGVYRTTQIQHLFFLSLFLK